MHLRGKCYIYFFCSTIFLISFVQFYSIKILHCDNTILLQCYRTTVPHCIETVPQHYSFTVPQNVTMLQCKSGVDDKCFVSPGPGLHGHVTGASCYWPIPIPVINMPKVTADIYNTALHARLLGTYPCTCTGFCYPRNPKSMWKSGFLKRLITCYFHFEQGKATFLIGLILAHKHCA